MPKKSSAKTKSKKIDLDNELIIGMNQKKKKNATNKKRQKTKNAKKQKIIKKIIKWCILITALICSILFFFSTPLFNITQITVQNNTKISSDTIEQLSGIKIGDNLYKLSKKQIISNIKQNPYVESVQVKRMLPNSVEIIIKERQATYVLEVGNGYMTINNQGYMLELEADNTGLPIINGFSTEKENVVEGKRLNEEDLTKLGTVLKIIDSINVNGITEKVTSIDVSSKQNYTLIFEEEQKTVYLGDASDISTRIFKLKNILLKEKGKVGEIFINGDTKTGNPYFREKI